MTVRYSYTKLMSMSCLFITYSKNVATGLWTIIKEEETFPSNQPIWKCAKMVFWIQNKSVKKIWFVPKKEKRSKIEAVLGFNLINIIFGYCPYFFHAKILNLVLAVTFAGTTTGVATISMWNLKEINLCFAFLSCCLDRFR